MNRAGGPNSRERCHGHRRVLARRAGGRSPDRPRHEERRGRPQRARASARAGRARAIAGDPARKPLSASAPDHGDGAMLTLLMVAGGMGIVSATTALWTHGRQMLHQRVFALLVSFTVTVILFSLIAWAAAAIAAMAPRLLIW